MEKDLLMKTDLELVDEVRAGVRIAFSELVRRHQRPLLRLCLRFVRELSYAEDIVQESFIKAYEKLALFEGRSSFKSWLFQIAVNNARNKLREFKPIYTNVENVRLAVPATAERDLIHSAVARILQNEVDKLPFRQRTALVLRVYEDLSFHEIAEIMECPYDTAKANYRHAVMHLREVLEDREDLKEWSPEMVNLFEMNRYAEVEG